VYPCPLGRGPAIELDNLSPYSSLAGENDPPKLPGALSERQEVFPESLLDISCEFWAEMFIKGSLMVTLADWQMCGEANAKTILR
jgi:hypothetical protein